MGGLLRLLFWGLLLYAGYRIFKGLITPKPNAASVEPVSEETVQDPVCGVYLSRSDAVIGNLEGTRHYFCSMGCLEKFREKLENKS